MQISDQDDQARNHWNPEVQEFDTKIGEQTHKKWEYAGLSCPLDHKAHIYPDEGGHIFAEDRPSSTYYGLRAKGNLSGAHIFHISHQGSKEVEPLKNAR